MISLLITVILACVAIYIVKVTEKISDRVLKMKEREQDTKEVKISAKPLEPVPNFLWSWANGDSEQWARDDKVKLLNEQYSEHGDWAKVAHAIGVTSGNT